MSFLYRWHDSKVHPNNDGEATATLSSYGDVPLPRVPRAELPEQAEATDLLEYYFCFATPTFRFLHRQTLERAMASLLRGQPTSAAQAACVLILWAQSLLYREGASSSESMASQRSLSYFEQGRALLESEPGPAQVSSVEARLAACLYLLSTSRINTCRFLFAFTHTLVITLGLHRKTTKRHGIKPLESERRRRVFWSFYTIDGYLSVLLGQPRQVRDNDIDQDFPANVEDYVLDTAGGLSQVPHHGNLEALINHAKLARLLSQTNDLLYPIHQLSKDEIVERGEAMIAAIDELEQHLPAFLQTRVDASVGTQTWERQNSVLGLAIAHARIIATRRTILLDTSPTAWTQDNSMRHRHETCVRRCLGAIASMLDRVHPMVQHGRLRRGFWLTQYVTMCAVSTLFVFKLQRSRGRMSFALDVDLDAYFGMAIHVQEYMASIVTPGSQAKRQHTLFARLKQQAKDGDLGGQSVVPRSLAVDRRDVPEAGDGTALSSGSRTRPSDEPFAAPSSLDNDGFTPSNMFDLAMPDTSSWQYLDQLLPDGFDSALWSV